MKNTKIVALVATAALLVIGAAFTSMAATYSWYQVDGIWHCKDKNGDDICQDWAKSGNDMYYLDENGEMVTESFLEVDDDYYYVDADGKMVKNQWVKVENQDDDGDEYYWYYFQTSGKAKKAKEDNKPVTINGKKYMFTSDAKMLYGWFNLGATEIADQEDNTWRDAAYYAGGADDGSIKTGWAKIDVIDETADFEDQSYWFWFGSNGQKVYSKNVDELLEKTINGKKYAFDGDGVMKAEWEQIATYSEASGSIASTNIAGYAWFQDAETGAKLKKGWFRVIPKDKVNPTDNDDEVAHWFYAKGNGELYKDVVKSINGKKYAFNEKGEMLAGLYMMDIRDGQLFNKVAIDTEKAVGDLTTVGNEIPYEENWGVYFFGDEETDGSMKYGTIKTEIDGDEYTFLFNTTGANKGKAVEGLKGNAWYVNGAKVKADSDLRYAPFEATFEDNKIKTVDAAAKAADVTAKDKYCLISASGAIVKSGTKKDADDNKFKVSNYAIIEKNGTVLP